MDIKDTKLLVGVVTHEEKNYCQEEFIKQIVKVKHPNYSIYLVDNTKHDTNKEEIELLKETNKIGHKYNQFVIDKDVWNYDARARIGTSYNKVREFFLKGDFTHLLLIESDIFPENFDFIEKWINYDKPVISGMYKLFSLGIPPSLKDHPDWKWQYSVWYKRKIIEGGKLYTRWIDKDIANTGIIKMGYEFGGYGTGLLMLQRDILYQMTFKSGFGTADSFIKHELDTIQIDSYLDTDLKIDHKNKMWDEVLIRDVNEVKKMRWCGDFLKKTHKKENKEEN